jgi:hypothetical protein
VRPRRRPLIIDASVAQAAGTSEYPVPAKCRAFLQGVLDICHRLAVTDAIVEEWNRHQSRFTRAWLRSMRARRKVDWFQVKPDQELHDRICVSATNHQEREGMLKDIHLIEAALHADAPVVSLDENTARRPFRSACRTLRRLRRIVWVNPAVEAEAPIQWLENGAPDEDHRRIGYGVEV